jgi:integrase
VSDRGTRTPLRDGCAPGYVALHVTILRCFFRWLDLENLLEGRRSPMDRIIRPSVPKPDDNPNIVAVTVADVGKLRVEADRSGRWDERLTINALAYLGPRRHALALARISDYDPDERKLRFLEKGGKAIRKPVPDRFADLIDAAIAAGVYEQEEYLIPNRRARVRTGDRDDRVIWRIVKDVAGRAGVTTHVHALRAAFADYFLEAKPGQIEVLQELMGHESIETTRGYLRRRNRAKAMETIRDLDWDISPVAKTDAAEFPQTAGIALASSAVVGERGFEPLLDDKPRPERPGRQPDEPAPVADASALPAAPQEKLRELSLAAKAKESDRA